MSTCNLDELLADACANGFLCLDENTQAAIELQLLKAASGDESTLDELKEQACANGFYCQDEQQFNAIALQLLCNATGGGGCVNLIPDGATYNDVGGYTINTLQLGVTYTITWGDNEVLAVNAPDEYLSTGPGTSTTFTATDTALFLVGNSITGVPVTAIVCAQ